MNVLRTMARHRLSLIAGLAITVLGGLAWAAGMWQRLDDFGLDLHFRHFSTIPADSRIVMIDIDDRTLETVPYSFPWPRRVFADAVRLLDEFGASTIVLDIVFDTPDEPRQVDAAPGRHYDLEAELPAPADDRPSPPIHIYDDEELAAAVTESGRVIIPMLAPLAETNRSPAPDADFTALVERIRTNFSLSEPELLGDDGRRLKNTSGADPSLHYFLRAKRTAARSLARAFLEAHGDASLADFLATVLPPERVDVRDADREELTRAFRHAHALREITARLMPAIAYRDVNFPTLGHPILPLARFARGARAVGFASWDRDAAGPTVRELPPLAVLEDRMIFQLGMAAALHERKLDASNLEIHADRILLKAPDRTYTIPLTSNSSLLINWHRPTSGRWQDSFTHLPFSRLVEVASLEEARAENERRVRALFGDLVSFRCESLPAELADYRELVYERRKLEDQIRRTTSADDRRRLQERIDQLSVAMGAIEREALDWLRHRRRLWADETPRNVEEQTEKSRVEALGIKLVENPVPDRLTAINEKLAGRISTIKAELQPLIHGKLCFIGYTASAQADLVATPVHPAMPGAMVHANVANTLLQDRPARRASTAISLAAMILLGLTVTFLSSARGGVFGIAALVVVLVITLVLGALVFRYWVYHWPSVALCAATSAVWASVTLCRQLIEERSRRRFQSALAQYTSPAIAARIADRASAADLAPRSAVVTCFFADLQGFTTLSERLGPERTQRILNPYLKAISDVLIRHNAMVNKFMGDGIFAFFNAPIWPCVEPAAAACRSALAAQRALAELNRTVIEKEAGAALKMRIGLSTGEVFVGDYGSDHKLDYTCIGDNVNVAGRLQAANKEFGTRILVDDSTRSAAGNGFTFRPLGQLTLAGKTRAVLVHELCTDAERKNPAQR